MIRVLIVEDEMIVLVGICNLLKWEEYGCEIVGTASDGNSAYSLYLEKNPDIIITDIKIPGMDGLGLISKIREKDSQTKIIILTAYDEFDLLHQAMHYQISDYLLKLDLDEQTLAQVIKKAVDECTIEKKSAPSDDQVSHTAPNEKKEQVLDRLIIGRNIEAKEFDALAKALNLRLSSDQLYLCIMSFAQNDSILSDDKVKSKNNMLWNTVSTLINQLLETYHNGEMLHGEKNNYWIIFGFDSTVSSPMRAAEKILSHIATIIRNYMNFHVTFGVSSCGNGWKTLPQLYEEAKISRERLYYMSDEMICWFNAPVPKRDKIRAENKIASVWEKLTDIPAEYMKILTSGREKLLMSFETSRNNSEEIILHMIYWPLFGKDSENKEQNEADSMISTLTSLREHQYYIEDIQALCDKLSEINRDFRERRVENRRIDAVTTYLKQHYSEKVAISDLAKSIGLSPNYLGSLFRKSMGMGIVDYLNSLKIEKAKELLTLSDMNISEISDALGFTDVSYFSRIFKNYTGMSPKHYSQINFKGLLKSEKNGEAHEKK